MKRRFIESREFTRRFEALRSAGELTDEDLSALQIQLIEDPSTGDLVQGSGGVRKVRMALPARGRGKSFGVRAFVLDLAMRKHTHLLTLFGKNESSDLSPPEKKLVKQLAEAIKKETTS